MALGYFTIKVFATDKDASPVATIEKVTNLQRTWGLNEPYTVSLTIPLTDDQAAQIGAGTTTEGSYVQILTGNTSQEQWGAGYITGFTRTATHSNEYQINLSSPMLRLAEMRNLGNLIMVAPTYNGILDFLNGVQIKQQQNGDGTTVFGQGILSGTGWVAKAVGFTGDLPGKGDALETHWENILKNLQMLADMYHFYFRETPQSTATNGVIEFGPLGDQAHDVNGAPLEIWGGEPLAQKQKLSRPDASKAQRDGLAVITGAQYVEDDSQLYNLIWPLGSGSGQSLVTLQQFMPDAIHDDGTLNLSVLTEIAPPANAGPNYRRYYKYTGYQPQSWEGHTYTLVLAEENLVGHYSFGLMDETSASTWQLREDAFANKKNHYPYTLLSQGAGYLRNNAYPIPIWTFPVKYPLYDRAKMPPIVRPGQSVNVHYKGYVPSTITFDESSEQWVKSGDEYVYLEYPGTTQQIILEQLGNWDSGSSASFSTPRARIVQVDESWSERQYLITFTVGMKWNAKHAYNNALADQIQNAEKAYYRTHHWKKYKIDDIPFVFGTYNSDGSNPAHPDSKDHYINLTPNGFVVSDAKTGHVFNDHTRFSFQAEFQRDDQYIDVYFAKPKFNYTKENPGSGHGYGVFRLALKWAKGPDGKKVYTGFYYNDGTRTDSPGSSTPLGATRRGYRLDHKIEEYMTKGKYNVEISWAKGTFQAHISMTYDSGMEVGQHDLVAVWHDTKGELSEYDKSAKKWTGRMGAIGFSLHGNDAQWAFISDIDAGQHHKATKHPHGGSKGGHTHTGHKPKKTPGNGSKTKPKKHAWTKTILDEDTNLATVVHAVDEDGNHHILKDHHHGTYADTIYKVQAALAAGVSHIDFSPSLKPNSLAVGQEVLITDNQQEEFVKVTKIYTGDTQNPHYISGIDFQNLDSQGALQNGYTSDVTLSWDAIEAALGDPHLAHRHSGTWHHDPTNKKKTGYKTQIFPAGSENAFEIFSDGSFGKSGKPITDAQGDVFALTDLAASASAFATGIEHEGVILFDAGEYDSGSQAVEVWNGGSKALTITPSTAPGTDASGNPVHFYGAEPTDAQGSWLESTSDGALVRGENDKILQLTTSDSSGTPVSGFQATAASGKSAVRWYDPQIKNHPQDMTATSSSQVAAAGSATITLSSPILADELRVGDVVNYDAGDNQEAVAVTAVTTTGDGKHITAFTASFTQSHQTPPTGGFPIAWTATRNKTYNVKHDLSLGFPVYIANVAGSAAVTLGATDTLRLDANPGDVTLYVSQSPDLHNTQAGDIWVIDHGTSSMEFFAIASGGADTSAWSLTATGGFANQHKAGAALAMVASQTSLPPGFSGPTGSYTTTPTTLQQPAAAGASSIVANNSLPTGSRIAIGALGAIETHYVKSSTPNGGNYTLALDDGNGTTVTLSSNHAQNDPVFWALDSGGLVGADQSAGASRAGIDAISVGVVATDSNGTQRTFRAWWGDAFWQIPWAAAGDFAYHVGRLPGVAQDWFNLHVKCSQIGLYGNATYGTCTVQGLELGIYSSAAGATQTVFFDAHHLGGTSKKSKTPGSGTPDPSTVGVTHWKPTAHPHHSHLYYWVEGTDASATVHWEDGRIITHDARQPNFVDTGYTIQAGVNPTTGQDYAEHPSNPGVPGVVYDYVKGTTPQTSPANNYLVFNTTKWPIGLFDPTLSGGFVVIPPYSKTGGTNGQSTGFGVVSEKFPFNKRAGSGHAVTLSNGTYSGKTIKVYHSFPDDYLIKIGKIHHKADDATGDYPIHGNGKGHSGKTRNGSQTRGKSHGHVQHRGHFTNGAIHTVNVADANVVTAPSGSSNDTTHVCVSPSDSTAFNTLGAGTVVYVGDATNTSTISSVNTTSGQITLGSALGTAPAAGMRIAAFTQPQLQVHTNHDQHPYFVVDNGPKQDVTPKGQSSAPYILIDTGAWPLQSGKPDAQDCVILFNIKHPNPNDTYWNSSHTITNIDGTQYTATTPWLAVLGGTDVTTADWHDWMKVGHMSHDPDSHTKHLVFHGYHGNSAAKHGTTNQNNSVTRSKTHHHQPSSHQPHGLVFEVTNSNKTAGTCTITAHLRLKDAAGHYYGTIASADGQMFADVYNATPTQNTIVLTGNAGKHLVFVPGSANRLYMHTPGASDLPNGKPLEHWSNAHAIDLGKVSEHIDAHTHQYKIQGWQHGPYEVHGENHARHSVGKKHNHPSTPHRNLPHNIKFSVVKGTSNTGTGTATVQAQLVDSSTDGTIHTEDESRIMGKLPAGSGAVQVANFPKSTPLIFVPATDANGVPSYEPNYSGVVGPTTISTGTLVAATKSGSTWQYNGLDLSDEGNSHIHVVGKLSSKPDTHTGEYYFQAWHPHAHENSGVHHAQNSVGRKHTHKHIGTKHHHKDIVFSITSGSTATLTWGAGTLVDNNGNAIASIAANGTGITVSAGQVLYFNGSTYATTSAGGIDFEADTSVGYYVVGHFSAVVDSSGYLTLYGWHGGMNQVGSSQIRSGAVTRNKKSKGHPEKGHFVNATFSMTGGTGSPLLNISGHNGGQVFYVPDDGSGEVYLGTGSAGIIGAPWAYGPAGAIVLFNTAATSWTSAFYPVSPGNTALAQDSGTINGIPAQQWMKVGHISHDVDPVTGNYIFHGYHTNSHQNSSVHHAAKSHTRTHDHTHKPSKHHHHGTTLECVGSTLYVNYTSGGAASNGSSTLQADDGDYYYIAPASYGIGPNYWVYVDISSASVGSTLTPLVAASLSPSANQIILGRISSTTDADGNYWTEGWHAGGAHKTHTHHIKNNAVKNNHLATGSVHAAQVYTPGGGSVLVTSGLDLWTPAAGVNWILRPWAGITAGSPGNTAGGNLTGFNSSGYGFMVEVQAYDTSGNYGVTPASGQSYLNGWLRLAVLHRDLSGTSTYPGDAFSFYNYNSSCQYYIKRFDILTDGTVNCEYEVSNATGSIGLRFRQVYGIQS